MPQTSIIIIQCTNSVTFLDLRITNDFLRLLDLKIFELMDKWIIGQITKTIGVSGSQNY